jgi:hypothetical protein
MERDAMLGGTLGQVNESWYVRYIQTGRLPITLIYLPRVPGHCYCSFAYSALASFRMGISGSASFQRVKKS